MQGICSALALVERGYRVTLVEQDKQLFNRTSLRNEGKIHLGFVYAKDDSFETSQLMLEGALTFAPEIENHAREKIDWEEICSTPFDYLISTDSMLSADSLLDFYEDLNRQYVSLVEDSGYHYLGRRPDRIWRTVRLPPSISGCRVRHVATTEERSIDPFKLRKILCKLVKANERITVLPGFQVEQIKRTEEGFEVLNGRRRSGAEIVINCSWQGRIGLDEQMGVHPHRPWVYRLKYRLLGIRPRKFKSMNSMTQVLGPFGDVVAYPRVDCLTYFSWYPACMRGWCADAQTPREWEGALCGMPDGFLAREIANETLDAFDRLLPGIRKSKILHVDAGVIFSWGETDISDVRSEFHARSDIGVQNHDGYFTINTGKLTTAPLFARRLVDQYL